MRGDVMARRKTSRPKPDWRVRWDAYEARKAEVAAQGLSADEYEQAVRSIAKELGV